ncbi:UPF0016 domain-containing protein [Cordyceps javanica]|uniref:UPF0016 domain-containing protein n=1 Tax=Cordyceps javanica TaxID=43265 RepID=A0A545VHC9_9HYPO|nr:UPF0016 domain-containing protein [Cordyceps javanica]TQW12213.1 UPF0016 domain protein [Cordyceps javanica]
MRFNSNSSFLLLILPALVGALKDPASAAAGIAAIDDSSAVASSDDVTAPKGRTSLPTKDAPVDGRDGKPHQGPFVETDGKPAKASSDAKSSSAAVENIKGRPQDPTIVDGKKIPESNDGIMFDKNREKAKEGTTGTQGGVTEKDKYRKAQEGKTGEKLITQPESPKEKLPLPHSEEEKMNGGKEKPKTKPLDKEAIKDGDNGGYAGFDKPDDLGEKAREQPPVPQSVDKDHLEIHKPATTTPKSTSKTPPSDGDEGIIQPFHSFVLSLTMILVSEVGDKTFLVAALMAMKHDRLVVFSAAFGALLVMTFLSAVLGHAVPTLIPKRLTSLLAAGLFFVFGAKLLREGMQMDPNEGVGAEMHEVEQELAAKEKEFGRDHNGGTMSADALEMGLNGRGSRSKGRLGSPPRSPSQSPSRHPSRKAGPVGGFLYGASNLCSLLISPIWVQTFVMTFLGEWGDRSQIATIAMAAGQDYWWVTLGATVGHAICTGVAVIGGRAIAGRVSLKVVTVGGAVAFLAFGLIYFVESFYA